MLSVVKEHAANKPIVARWRHGGKSLWEEVARGVLVIAVQDIIMNAQDKAGKNVVSS